MTQAPPPPRDRPTALAEAYQNRLCFPFSYGVVLAANAVADAHLLLDAPPGCGWSVIDMMQAHDGNSSLLDFRGHARIYATSVDASTVITDRSAEIRASLRQLAEQPGCGLVMAASFPMAAVIGTRYEPLYEASEASAKRPFAEIRATIGDGDWLDGYARSLETFAATIELAEGRPGADKVAVVGYLLDRTEMEHTANIDELRRMLGALGLELVSVWLDGGRFGELARVADAGAILSLPYGREAARVLARRTRARLVETGLPFGLEKSVQWLRQVGAALGREEAAEAAIDAELRETVCRLRWVVERGELQRDVVFLGDPYHLPGLHGLVRDVGGRVEAAFLTCRDRHVAELAATEALPTSVAAEAGVGELYAFLAERGGAADRTLLVHCHPDRFGGRPVRAIPAVNFGFPSFQHHALGPTPFLGFRGALSFVSRLLAAVRAESR